MTRSYLRLTIVVHGALVLLMPHVSPAQDPGATLKYFEDRTAILEEQFRDELDRSPETRKELLEAISGLRTIAEAMGAEKNLILGAFPNGLPPKELPSLVILVWELGYLAATAEMLADEWERMPPSPRPQAAPTEETGQRTGHGGGLGRWHRSWEDSRFHENPAEAMPQPDSMVAAFQYP
ncbi:MAG: hypothetical protein OXL40_00870 [Bacteroidota bacterium]|nr:hypothetical protein [Bacteroidota bacterium]